MGSGSANPHLRGRAELPNQTETELKQERRCANTAHDNKSTLTPIKEDRAICNYTAIGALKSKMRKLHIKRIPGSLLEPANRPPLTSTKSTVLETIAEIACLLASLTLGWIAYVVF